MIDQEREDYRQAISLLLGALDARRLFPRDEAVRFAWEVMERYCVAARIDGTLRLNETGGSVEA